MTVQRPLPVEGQQPRITELWAWTAIDPMTDVEGIIAAKMPGGGAMPMVTTMRSMAERMKPWADQAVASAEAPKPILQLRRFVPAEEE